MQTQSSGVLANSSPPSKVLTCFRIWQWSYNHELVGPGQYHRKLSCYTHDTCNSWGLWVCPDLYINVSWRPTTMREAVLITTSQSYLSPSGIPQPLFPPTLLWRSYPGRARSLSCNCFIVSYGIMLMRVSFRENRGCRERFYVCNFDSTHLLKQLFSYFYSWVIDLFKALTMVWYIQDYYFSGLNTSLRLERSWLWPS